MLLCDFVGEAIPEIERRRMHAFAPAAPGAKGWLAGAPAIALGKQGDPQDADHDYETDPDRVDEAVLALLVRGLHDGSRAWKGFDWDALDRLQAKGLISNPASRAKSIVFSEDGLEAALRSHRLLFPKRPAQSKYSK